MPTTVHIPKEILKAVDRKARALGISRNRFILNALENVLKRESEWSPGFLEKLAEPLPKDASEALDEMVAHIMRNRSRGRKVDL